VYNNNGPVRYGLEIEIEGAGRTLLDNINDFGIIRCRLGDDGSIRNPVFSVDNLTIIPISTKNGKILPTGVREAERIGLEVITDVASYEEMHLFTQKMSLFLRNTPQTPRASIHFHVDVSDQSWRYVQNLLAWCYYLEAILYRCSSAGRVHRGARTSRGSPVDYMYCRPLSASICINRRPLVDIDRLLRANSASEFLASWGRLDMFFLSEQRMPHYVPHRLMGVNLYSVLRQGSFEWRLFDGVYDKMNHFFQLICAVHNIAQHRRPQDIFKSPFLLGSKPEINVSEISDILGVDLRSIWGSDWQPGVVDIYRQSHYSGSWNSPLISERPVVRVSDNYNHKDDDTDDFSLYRSSKKATPPVRESSAASNPISEIFNLPSNFLVSGAVIVPELRENQTLQNQYTVSHSLEMYGHDLGLTDTSQLSSYDEDEAYFEEDEDV